MTDTGFRARALGAADRVRERTGLDPLDDDLALRVLADARIEMLPGSIGIGLGGLAITLAVSTVVFLTDPHSRAGVEIAAGFGFISVVLASGVVACILLARAARARRPHHELYEDAWARFAIEVWPHARYRHWSDGGGTAYSRAEFLRAFHSGAPLDDYLTHPPFTRRLG